MGPGILLVHGSLSQSGCFAGLGGLLGHLQRSELAQSLLVLGCHGAVVGLQRCQLLAWHLLVHTTAPQLRRLRCHLHSSTDQLFVDTTLPYVTATGM